jgi:hypothetical protein
MKKHILWLLLLFSGFTLFAQTIPSYYIYIAPVSGIGKGPEDNAFFAGSLAGEVTANNHIITGRQNRSDFTITPELGPMPGQAGQLFVLHITLTDRKTKKVITEQELIYASLEEAEGLLKVVISSSFAAIAAQHEELVAWRNKWLYFGGSVFWAPRIYSGYEQSVHMVNLGAELFTELQFLDFMSVETGVTMAPDWVGVMGMEGEEYLDWVLEIPLLLKLSLKPALYYMIEPYAGIKANFPMYNVGRPPRFSLLAGLKYGVKAGQGIFFVDASYSMDIGSSKKKRKSDNVTIPFKRYMINIGFGYKFGVFNR